VALQNVEGSIIKSIASHVLINEEKKVYLNCYKFENIDTLCLLIEEENQGWGFEK
jgi:hypothetical protein